MYTGFLSEINWIAVLVAALAYFALGALWYSKALFANKWIAYTRVDVNDPNMMKGVAATMGFSFVCMLLTSIGLAILQVYLGREGWMSGLKVGLLVGLFFSAASITISYLYEKRPMGLHFINNGYTVIGTIIAAIIIFSWT